VPLVHRKSHTNFSEIEDSTPLPLWLRIVLFYVLFVSKCVLYYCHRVFVCKCVLYYCQRVFVCKCVLYYCHRLFVCKCVLYYCHRVFVCKCVLYYCHRVFMCKCVLYYCHRVFVCKCVLYYCQSVATQLQLNISYHIVWSLLLFPLWNFEFLSGLVNVAIVVHSVAPFLGKGLLQVLRSSPAIFILLTF
jgi:hypothetical protein